MNSIPPRNDWNNGAIYPFSDVQRTTQSKTVQCVHLEEFTTECRFS